MDHIVMHVREKQAEPAIDNYKLNGFIMPPQYTELHSNGKKNGNSLTSLLSIPI